MDEIVVALEKHALVLAVVLPPAIRIAGHWLPEEPLMMAMGALASRAGWDRALVLLGVLWASHVGTDHVVYHIGRALAPRLERWPRVAAKVRPATARIAASRFSLIALLPARVLPLGRGAWLAGFGAAGVSRPSFAVADGVAVAVHLLVWCGLGWWLGSHADDVLVVAKPALLWLVTAIGLAIAGLVAWRRRRPQGGLGHKDQAS